MRGNQKFYSPVQEEAGSNELLTKEISREKIKVRQQPYQLESTKNLIALVNNAAELIGTKGEDAFNDFRVPGSAWQKGETYIFILDLDGNMLVHPDVELEGKNQIELKDVDGKPIIRGLISAATTFPEKPEGWYHYQWPVPDGLIPRWKSSYVRMVKAPSGKTYIVGSGMYNDSMEKEFVVDMVRDAVALIEQKAEKAFSQFHDPQGPFMVKDAYVFVIDQKGIDLVNPGFPNLEGRNIMDLKDSNGKFLIKEMFNVVEKSGSGWVEYMWPKPGETIPTQKSTYVTKAKTGDKWFLVGCGVYLAEAPVAITKTKKITAPELMDLVREAAKVLELEGEKAFTEFRKKDSKWFHDDTYFFVWNMDGVRVFHAADATSEGANVSNLKDVLGRPMGKMFLEAAASPVGEGWIHYMWPEPGDIFPAWKSSFVKRVTFPSGKQFLVGCGIYNMQMDKAFIEDVVNRAFALVEKEGKEAFPKLRDKKGPFYFMDTYVFVFSPDGVEHVNPAQPSLEGKNLFYEKDINGKYFTRSFIDAAMKNGTAWEDYYWYRSGQNTVSYKNTFVRKVQHGDETFVLGSGYYTDDMKKKQN